jgi:hypothetical protein
LSLIGESDDSLMKLFCDPMVFDHSQGAEAASSIGLQLPRDYLYWVLVFRRDVLERAGTKRTPPPATAAQSAELALELTRHWSPQIRTILLEQDRIAAAALTFLACNPHEIGTNFANSSIKEAKRVTLLGDAAHPVPPVGGFGGTSMYNHAYLCGTPY